MDGSQKMASPSVVRGVFLLLSRLSSELRTSSRAKAPLRTSHDKNKLTYPPELEPLTSVEG